MTDEFDPEVLATEELRRLFPERPELPNQSPLKPVQLTGSDTIRFHCHPGVSCFNVCCKSINIQLTPYDIIRLKRRLGLDAADFVARYTVPFEMDQHGMPGLRLAVKPGTSECAFLGEEGCTVYEDRPTACRYYPLGNMGVRKVGESEVEELYFLVQERHCKGHEEPRTISIDDYRSEQEVQPYEEMNADWREIVLKKRSAGPTIGAPSARSLQLFDMCSYDMENFRRFTQSPGFNEMFDLDAETRARLDSDDDEYLLDFAMDFLRQVLFGEQRIPKREGADQMRYSQRREVIERKREEARRAHRLEDPRDLAED